MWETKKKGFALLVDSHIYIYILCVYLYIDKYMNGINDIVLLLINVNMNRVLENECKKWILVYNNNDKKKIIYDS